MFSHHTYKISFLSYDHGVGGLSELKSGWVQTGWTVTKTLIQWFTDIFSPVYECVRCFVWYVFIPWTQFFPAVSLAPHVESHGPHSAHKTNTCCTHSAASPLPLLNIETMRTPDFPSMLWSKAATPKDSTHQLGNAWWERFQELDLLTLGQMLTLTDANVCCTCPSAHSVSLHPLPPSTVVPVWPEGERGPSVFSDWTETVRFKCQCLSFTDTVQNWSESRVVSLSHTLTWDRPPAVFLFITLYLISQ